MHAVGVVLEKPRRHELDVLWLNRSAEVVDAHTYWVATIISMISLEDFRDSCEVCCVGMALTSIDSLQKPCEAHPSEDANHQDDVQDYGEPLHGPLRGKLTPPLTCAA